MEHKDFLIRLFAIIAVATLEVTALLKGIDGALLKLSFVLIGLLAGLTTSSFIQVFKTKK